MIQRVPVPRQGLIPGESLTPPLRLVEPASSSVTDVLATITPRVTGLDTEFSAFNNELRSAHAVSSAVWPFVSSPAELDVATPKPELEPNGKDTWSKWKSEQQNEALDIISRADSAEPPQGTVDRRGRVWLGSKWLRPIKVSGLTKVTSPPQEEAEAYLTDLGIDFEGLDSRRNNLMEIYYSFSLWGGDVKAFNNGATTVALALSRTEKLRDSLKLLSSDSHSEIAFDIAVHPEKHKLLKQFLTKELKQQPNDKDTPSKYPVMARFCEGLDTMTHVHTDVHRFPVTAKSFSQGEYAMLYSVMADDPQVFKKMQELQAMRFDGDDARDTIKISPNINLASALAAAELAIKQELPIGFRLAAELAASNRNIKALSEEQTSGSIPAEISGFSSAFDRYFSQERMNRDAYLASQASSRGVNGTLIAILRARQHSPYLRDAINGVRIIKHLFTALKIASDQPSLEMDMMAYPEASILRPDCSGLELEEMAGRCSSIGISRREWLLAIRFGSNVTAAAFAQEISDTNLLQSARK